MAERSWVDYRELASDDEFSHGTMYDVSGAFGSENQSISVIEFEPGEGGPLSYHAEPVEELYFVLEGTFEIQLDDETYTGGPGTTALVRPGVHHRPVNVGDAPAVLLVVQSPPAENTTYVEG